MSNREMQGPVTEPNLTLVRNTAKNSWQVNVYWTDTKDRTRTLLHVPLDKDPAVRFKEWQREVLPEIIEEHFVEVEAARVLASSGPTIHDVAKWFLDVDSVHNKRSEKRVAHCHRVLRDFMMFCSGRNCSRIQQVSWPLIQEWQIWMRTRRREHKGRSADRDELTTLRFVFNEAADAGKIPERLNFIWKIPSKAKGSQYVALSLAKTKEFYAALDEHGRDIYDPTWWMYLTGWLPSDVFDLRIRELHLDDNYIERNRIKADKPMPHQPINAAMRVVIERNLRKRPLDSKDELFLDPKGHPWSYDTYKKRLEYFCKKHFNGMNVRPRDLRKTFGTHMALAGESPKVVKELMAHEKIETALEYYTDVDLPELTAASTRHLDRFNAKPVTTENLATRSQRSKKGQ